ncbi:MAG: hypothetical protein ACO1N8_06420 [Methylophilus sp.]
MKKYLILSTLVVFANVANAQKTEIPNEYQDMLVKGSVTIDYAMEKVTCDTSKITPEKCQEVTVYLKGVAKRLNNLTRSPR